MKKANVYDKPELIKIAFNVCYKLEQRNIKITKSNVITGSLFHSGGTLAGCKLVNELIKLYHLTPKSI